MTHFIHEPAVLPGIFQEKTICEKVKNVFFEPSGANLAILELEEESDSASFLKLGSCGEGVFTGISTAYPTLLGNPKSLDKALHTFSYDSLIPNEHCLESLFLLPTSVDVDTVRTGAIMRSHIKCIYHKSTSILTNGDDGAPILQNGVVVAVAGGWDLSETTLEDTRVRILANTFTLVAPYLGWIESIIAGSSAAATVTASNPVEQASVPAKSEDGDQPPSSS